MKEDKRVHLKIQIADLSKLVRELQAENERLKKALKPAERAIVLLHCNYEHTRAPHDGNIPGCEVCDNLKVIQQALKQSGDGKDGGTESTSPHI